MAAIRPIDTITEKFITVTPGRATQYKQGVENPLRDWEENALAAEVTYKRGVTEAANRGMYGKGVKKAGTRKWQKGAAQKGPTRFSEGVMLAKDAYKVGFAPYAEEIARIELPPRGPKGDPANIQRVAVIAKALRERKLAEME